MIILKAKLFATAAHLGQVRKYTQDPYIHHPVRVAKMIEDLFDDPEMIAAALLHDTVEDADVCIDRIRALFGIQVATLVEELTDITILSDGNRRQRKTIEQERLAKVSAEAQSIKLADLIDNSESIILHDPKFAPVYMDEKRKLLQVLTKGHPKLQGLAQTLVDHYFAKREVL